MAETPKTEEADLPFMCFHVGLVHCNSFFFTFYRMQNDGTAMFDKIVEKIDNILSGDPSARIPLCDDFDIHHKDFQSPTN